MKKDYKYVSIKILSIAIISILFLGLGYVLAAIINYLQPSLYDSEEDRKNEIVRKSKPKLIFDIIITLILIAVGFYAIRQIIRLIPYPLEGFYGFKEKKMEEIHGVIFFAPVFFLLQPKLVEKITYIRNHIL